MTLHDIMNKIMGVTFEDIREPAVVHAPWACHCPVTDCVDMGMYTNCYLEDTMNDCHIYREKTR